MRLSLSLQYKVYGVSQYLMLSYLTLVGIVLPPHLMETESAVLGQQLRHINHPIISGPSTPPYTVEPRLPISDPLHGIVHEMAMSAVIQKHNTSAAPPSSSSPPTPLASTSSTLSNGSLLKSYYVQQQQPSSTGAPLIMGGGGGEAITSLANHTSLSNHISGAPQGTSVVLGPSPMQQGYITIATGSQGGGGGGGGNLSLLTHQASPLLQAAPLGLSQIPGQYQEPGGVAVQLTPVCYGNTLAPQPSPALEQRSALIQSNLVG